MGLKGGGGIWWTARVPSLSCKQAQNGEDSAKKSEQKNSDGVEGGGGILWTARVPPLSCEHAKNSGDSVTKSEQINSDGVEEGGGGWEGIDVVLSTPSLLPFFSAPHFARLSTIWMGEMRENLESSF